MGPSQLSATCQKNAVFTVNMNKYKALLKPHLRELQELLRNIQFIIIDEYSMLSQTMISIIDYRLREIFQRHALLFGGISIILTGYIFN